MTMIMTMITPWRKRTPNSNLNKDDHDDDQADDDDDDIDASCVMRAEGQVRVLTAKPLPKT